MKPFYYNTAFLAFFACFLWSTAFVGIKTGLPYSSPLQFAGLRFFFSGLIILPFASAGLKNFFTIVKAHIRIVLIISFLHTFLQSSFLYLGINIVPAALAAIIIGSGPLIVAMAAHYFMTDDKLTWKRLLIFMLGLSGVVLVTIGRNELTKGGEVKLLGVFLLLGTSILYAFSNIIISKNERKIPPLVLSSSSMIIGGAALILSSFPLEGFSFDIKPGIFYFSLGWLSLLSAAAISIWYILLGRPGVKVSDLNLWRFVIPVAGASLSWIFLADEKPTVIAVSGMIIVGTAVILMNLDRRRARRRQQSAGSINILPS